MMKHELILLVGLPRSGKSTWARKQNYPIVNIDSIRLALHGQRYQPEAEDFIWAITFIMVDALFKAGNTHVIVDATNNTERRRSKWKNKFKDIANIKLKIIKTSKEECIKRAKEGNNLHLIHVIERMDPESDWRKL